MLLGGCSTFTSTAPVEDRHETQAPVTEEQIAYYREKPPLREQPVYGNSAVVALLRQADAQSSQKRYVEAVATLERALRIEPGNAVVWQRLAEIRLDQGQFHQAETLAARSTSLAGNDPRLVARNWRIIANARHQQGNVAGARDAAARARSME
jgi:predicted Zn-dependent protease